MPYLHEDGVGNRDGVCEIGGELGRFPRQSQRVGSNVGDQRLVL